MGFHSKLTVFFHLLWCFAFTVLLRHIQYELFFYNFLPNIRKSRQIDNPDRVRTQLIRIIAALLYKCWDDLLVKTMQWTKKQKHYVPTKQSSRNIKALGKIKASRDCINKILLTVYHVVRFSSSFFNDVHTFCFGFRIFQGFPSFVNNWKNKTKSKIQKQHILQNTWFLLVIKNFPLDFEKKIV